MLVDLLSRQWLTLHGMVAMSGLAIYVIGSRTRRQRRHPSAAIAWVVSLTLMPYLALPLYLLFGSRKVVRRAVVPLVLQARTKPPDSQTGRFQHLAAAMGLPPACDYRQLAIHQDGLDALQALRRVILEARHTLDVCTFLIGRDALGQEVMALLMQRAHEGLRVRLMIDGIGAYLGGHPDLKPLSAAGVQVVRFVSPFASALPGRTNLRNHRKMVIADGQQLWTGGRNLAAEYFLGDAQHLATKAPWVDLSFDLSGELVALAQERFEQDWAFATQTPRRLIDAPLPEAPPHPSHDGHASSRAQLIASGPDQADDTFYSLLVASCFSAQSRILAVTPYFVPGATLLLALTLAARRGIAVDVVLPRQSNHRLADLARPAALRELVAAGARVWLLDTMIHAKAVVIDDELALVGSANLDERSLFLNYELMVAFFDSKDVHRFAHWIERQRSRATACQPHPPGWLRELAEGLIRWLAFQL